MDGTKAARIRTCRACAYRVTRHPDFAGPHGYSTFCRYLAPDEIELHDTYYEGAETNCPAGYWKGLAAVDLEAEEATRAAEALERQRGDVGPVLAALVQGMDETEQVNRLLVAVEAGLIEPEIANEIVEAAIEPRAAKTAL